MTMATTSFFLFTVFHINHTYGIVQERNPSAVVKYLLMLNQPKEGY